MKKKRIRKLQLIGRRELVKFPLLCGDWVEAKIDTGAYTCSLHCYNIHEVPDGGKSKLYFSLFPGQFSVEGTPGYCFEQYERKKIKSSTGESEERYVVRTLIEIAGRKINTAISLADRGSMRFPVLIGRKLLKGKFIVDVSKVNTGGIIIETEKSN